MTQGSFFESTIPRVFAHRGFSHGGRTATGHAVIENTLPAFALAIDAGAHYLETDVHASSDGVAVISHDPDLSRLANVDGTIASRTFDDVRSIDLGGSARLPSLAEALDAFPTARFNIDIKSADAVEPTVDAVLAAGATERVLVTSFSERRRLGAVRALPAVATSASAGSFLRALGSGKLGLSKAVARSLAHIDAVQVPERVLALAVTTRRFIEQLHGAGVEIHVWTINDAPAMHRLLDLGVDGIVTDRTDLALAVLNERS
jgi:glycerophosphoryl diester phosphodiesterase